MSPALDQFAKGLQPPVDAQAVASVRLSGFGVGISGKSPKGLKLFIIVAWIRGLSYQSQLCQLLKRSAAIGEQIVACLLHDVAVGESLVGRCG